MHNNRRSRNERRRERDNIQIIVEMRAQPAVPRTASHPEMALPIMTYPADVGPGVVGQEDILTGVNPGSFAFNAAPGSGEARQIDALVGSRRGRPQRAGTPSRS